MHKPLNKVMDIRTYICTFTYTHLESFLDYFLDHFNVKVTLSYASIFFKVHENEIRNVSCKQSENYACMQIVLKNIKIYIQEM